MLYYTGVRKGTECDPLEASDKYYKLCKLVSGEEPVVNLMWTRKCLVKDFSERGPADIENYNATCLRSDLYLGSRTVSCKKFEHYYRAEGKEKLLGKKRRSPKQEALETCDFKGLLFQLLSIFDLIFFNFIATLNLRY